MFAEAYRAEAQDFKVNAPCYSLHAWLDWRLNFDDPMQIQSAPLHPEPICNHTDLVANESEPDHFSNFLQNVDIPPDTLLDHSQPLAGVDGIPGSLQLLAVHPVLAHGVLAGASNHMSHAETPEYIGADFAQNDTDLAKNGAGFAENCTQNGGDLRWRWKLHPYETCTGIAQTDFSPK